MYEVQKDAYELSTRYKKEMKNCEIFNKGKTLLKQCRVKSNVFNGTSQNLASPPVLNEKSH